MMSAYIHIKLQMIRQRDDLHWQYYALHYQHTHCTVGDKLLEWNAKILEQRCKHRWSLEYTGAPVQVSAFLYLPDIIIIYHVLLRFPVP